MEAAAETHFNGEFFFAANNTYTEALFREKITGLGTAPPQRPGGWPGRRLTLTVVPISQQFPAGRRALVLVTFSNSLTRSVHRQRAGLGGQRPSLSPRTRTEPYNGE